MKETKVYVDELPESCFDCHCAHYGGCVIDTGNVEDFDNFDWSERRAKHCPLIDIKTHDRELVKEVCEKISIELENETKTYCEIRRCSSPHYQGDYVWFNYVKFRIFIAQILKEYEK